MTRHPFTPYLLLIAALLLTGTTQADNTRIELIELKGRTAEELIPLLQPVVQPGGALSGTGYKLIVRATDAQQREIRRLLAQLDQPPRRLLITVQMGQLSQREQQGGSLHIDRQSNGVGIALGDPSLPDEQGLSASQQDRNGAATIRLHSTRSLSDAADHQQVQALEGEPAFIATGSERPYPVQIETWQGPRGGGGGSVGYDYKQANTGFYAVAQVRDDDQVVVRISPQKEAFDRHGGGALDSQRIQTTVSGPLGSWLQIGSTGSTTTEGRQGTGRSISTRETDARPVWLKVELLR